MIKIEYFHNPVCPYCPAAETLVKKVIEGLKDIELVYVDTWTDEGIKRGMSLNLMAVPAVAINGVVKLIGWPFEAEDLQAYIAEAHV
ncbi:TPA: thioredoxin [Candidatus Bathyarchaeota archaeon]|nr:thioredoxin [Candidatus Bathyarchaeota archaeon]